MITNDTESVNMAQASKGIISDETVIANHPWVEDVTGELERLREQESIDLARYIDDAEGGGEPDE